MTFDRLKHQLQREIKKNPKQAIALGLLVVVACWFWAPLIVGWLPTGAGKPGSPATPNAVAAVATAEQPNSAEPASAAAPTWSQLAEWMQHDPLMAAAPRLASDRNPFVTPQTEMDAQLAATTKQRAKQQPSTPEQAGLTLSSTIVGAQRRTALINGRAYTEGKTIVQIIDGQPVAYELAEVHPKSIVLQQGQQRYELKLPQHPSTMQTVQLAPAALP